MPESYGFTISMSGDASAKLTELMTKFTSAAEGAKKVSGETKDIFSSTFMGMSLGGLATEAISKGFSAIKDEVMESEKAAIDYDRSLNLMKFSLRDMGDAGDKAFESMKMLSESSTLFSPQKILEATRSLSDVGGLNTKQISEMMPLLQDYAATSQYFYMDLTGAAKALAPAIETGAIRARDLKAQIIATGGELKKGDAVNNYAALLAALGKSAGGAAAQLKTMSGELESFTTKNEKIQEMAGSNSFTKLGAEISLGFTEFFHGEETAIVEGQDGIENALKKATKGTGEVHTAWKLYTDQLAKYKEALRGVANASNDEKGTAESNLRIQKALYDYASQRFDILTKIANIKVNKTDTDDDTGSYDKLSKEVAAKKKAIEDEYAAKKNVTNKEWQDYYALKLKMKSIDDKFSESAVKKSALTTSDLAGAAGGLGQAKVINITMDSVQKIVVSAAKAGDSIVSNADQAIPILIRTINNLTYSQSGTM